MPTKIFLELKEEKRKKIIGVGISEFAAYGYTNSSTNRIVKNSGISKGSLFQYFSNKEDLYFFILDIVTADFTESLEKKTNDLSPELFQRVIEYSILEFTWYIQNPEKAKLVIGAFVKRDSEIYRKTVERYGNKELDIYYRLMKENKQKNIDILKWFLKGFNESFLENAQIERDSFEQIQKEYVKSLTEYMEILKNGFLK